MWRGDQKKKRNCDHETSVNPHTSRHHSPLTLSPKGVVTSQLKLPPGGSCPSSEEQTHANNHSHNGSVFCLGDRRDNTRHKNNKKKRNADSVQRSTTNTAEVRESAHAQIVFWVVENVNALIYTHSLTIHSFVPFQQFVWQPEIRLSVWYVWNLSETNQWLIFGVQ